MDFSWLLRARNGVFTINNKERHAPAAGHPRRNEVQRALQPISARVLLAELKELEQTGFVPRTVHPQALVVVEYTLTPYSSALAGVVGGAQRLGPRALAARGELAGARGGEVRLAGALGRAGAAGRQAECGSCAGWASAGWGAAGVGLVLAR